MLIQQAFDKDFAMIPLSIDHPLFHLIFLTYSRRWGPLVGPTIF
jgi:hypothetical protein